MGIVSPCGTETLSYSPAGPVLPLVPGLSWHSRPAARVLPVAPRAGPAKMTTGLIWQPQRTRRAPAPLRENVRAILHVSMHRWRGDFNR